MIVFDLQCLASGDVFEAWFRSNADYDEQTARGLVECPACGSNRIAKAPMAPLVSRPAGEDARHAIARLAAAQAELLRDSEWVGDAFAEKARAMHLGEIESRQVHGNATAEDAKTLIEDGVPVAPLPLPVVPPNQVN